MSVFTFPPVPLQALQGTKDKGEAAAENDGVDVFSRRQTRSINYWATNRRADASKADKAAGDSTPPPGSTPPSGATPPPGTPGSSSKPFDIVEAAKQLDLQPVDMAHIRCAAVQAVYDAVCSTHSRIAAARPCFVSPACRLDPEVRKAKALLHACLGPNWRPEPVDLTGDCRSSMASNRVLIAASAKLMKPHRRRSQASRS